MSAAHPLHRRAILFTLALTAVTMFSTTSGIHTANASSSTPGEVEYSWSLSPDRSRVVTVPRTPPDAFRQLWKLCGFRDPEDKIIRTFPRMRATSPDGVFFRGGVANLRCGNANFGFKHIVKNHLGEWQTNAALTGDQWRDLVDFAVAATLIDPDQTTYRSTNDGFCYSRQIYLINNRTGKTVSILTPNIVIGLTSLNVITAIPKHQQCR